MSRREVALSALAFGIGTIAGVSGSWDTILKGVINGIIVAFLGYAKSSTTESFSAEKAVQTMIIGGFIGGIAGYYGWTYEQAYEWAATMGFITVFEYIKKAVWRWIKKLWEKWQQRKQEGGSGGNISGKIANAFSKLNFVSKVKKWWRSRREAEDFTVSGDVVLTGEIEERD